MVFLALFDLLQQAPSFLLSFLNQGCGRIEPFDLIYVAHGFPRGKPTPQAGIGSILTWCRNSSGASVGARSLCLLW